MRVEIDLTEDDTSEPPGDGSMACEPTITDDNGDMILEMGDVSFRMTFSQLDNMINKMVAWRDQT